MKTSKFPMRILGLFLAVCFVFTACNKDPENPDPTPTPTPTPTPEPEVPQEPFKTKFATINYQITAQEIGTMDAKLIFDDYGQKARGEMNMNVPGIGNIAVVYVGNEKSNLYCILIPLMKRYVLLDLNPVEEMFLFEGDDEGFTYAPESTKEQRTIAGKTCNVYTWQDGGITFEEGGWSRIILYSDMGEGKLEAQRINETAPTGNLFELPSDYTPMELPEFKSMVSTKSCKFLSLDK